jgi:hypothetical protein
MIYNNPVAVVRNKVRGLRKLSLPVYQGYDRGGYLRPFFIVSPVIVLHTLVVLLNGRLGVSQDYIRAIQSPDRSLTRLCARYWLNLVGHGETSYQIKRIASPSVEVGLLRRWAYGGGYSPLGVLLSKTK